MLLALGSAPFPTKAKDRWRSSASRWHRNTLDWQLMNASSSALCKPCDSGEPTSRDARSLCEWTTTASSSCSTSASSSSHSISKLMGFNFTVEFCLDRVNVVADTLSCREENTTAALNAVTRPSFHVFDDLHREIYDNTTLAQLWDKVAGDQGPTWAFHDNLLVYKKRVFVVVTSPSLPALLEATHVGHEGFKRMLHRLGADFDIPGAKKMVQEHVCMHVVR